MNNNTKRAIAVCGQWDGNIELAIDSTHTAVSSGAKKIIHTGNIGINMICDGSYIAKINRALLENSISLWFIDGNNDDQDYLRSLPTHRSGLRRMHNPSCGPELMRWLPLERKWHKVDVSGWRGIKN